MVGWLSIAPTAITLASTLVLLSVSATNEGKTCKHFGNHYHELYIGGRCIYVSNGVTYTRRNHDFKSAEANCSGLNKRDPYEWRLPKVDTIQKHRRLEDIMVEANASRRMWFYIDLVGDDEMSVTSWKTDLAKWRWTYDNTTLENFEGVVPWENTTEYNTTLPYVWMNGDKNARCVGSWKKPSMGKLLTWYVALCEQMPTDAYWGDFVLICESTNFQSSATTPTTPTTPATPITPAPAAKGYSGYVWSAIALTIIVIIALLIFIGYYLFRCDRKRRLAKLKIREGSDTIMSSNSNQSQSRYNFGKTTKLGTKESCLIPKKRAVKNVVEKKVNGSKAADSEKSPKSTVASELKSATSDSKTAMERKS